MEQVERLYEEFDRLTSTVVLTNPRHKNLRVIVKLADE